MHKTGEKFEEFVDIVRKLQGTNGCPWDRQQNHASLKPYMVEELYEAIEAIDSKNYHQLMEELGDLMLHICMHAEMGRRKNRFDINDIIESISAKMVRRHPHVFGKIKTSSINQVWLRWEKIKAKEKAKAGKKHQSMLQSIPQSLPALYRADKIQRRAARVGFDWDKIAGAWDKVYEEINEIEENLNKLDGKKGNKKIKERIMEEIGDLLFSLVNVSRKLDIDAEQALQKSSLKFMRRFAKIEGKLKKKRLTLAEMEKIWQNAKNEKQQN
jgi:tetrapyrrole methylase family protein / MazG family protein